MVNGFWKNSAYAECAKMIILGVKKSTFKAKKVLFGGKSTLVVQKSTFSRQKKCFTRLHCGFGLYC